MKCHMKYIIQRAHSDRDDFLSVCGIKGLNMSHELQMMIVTKRKRLDISILTVSNETFT